MSKKTTRQLITEKIEHLCKKVKLNLPGIERYNELFGTNLTETDDKIVFLRLLADYHGHLIDRTWVNPRDRLYSLIERMARRRETSDQENRNNLLRNNAKSLWKDLGYLNLDQVKLHNRTLTKEEYEAAIIRCINGQDGILPDALIELLKESRRNGYRRTRSTTGIRGKDLCHTGCYYPKTQCASESEDDIFAKSYSSRKPLLTRIAEYFGRRA
jgi:hypothetical protein